MIMHCHLLCVVVVMVPMGGKYISSVQYMMICDGTCIFSNACVCVHGVYVGSCIYYTATMVICYHEIYIATCTVSIIVHDHKK